MYTNELNIINKKIEHLINDESNYSFNTLKEKVENILNSVNMFTIDSELDTKAIDLYLRKVVAKRNEIIKQKEKLILNNKKNRYKLIEEICKKSEFETQEELIKKIEGLEKKSVLELNEILNNK